MRADGHYCGRIWKLNEKLDVLLYERVAEKIAEVIGLLGKFFKVF